MSLVGSGVDDEMLALSLSRLLGEKVIARVVAPSLCNARKEPP